jgi:hypothetical protein
MVAFESQPCINYKIKHKSKEDFIVYFVNLGCRNPTLG